MNLKTDYLCIVQKLITFLITMKCNFSDEKNLNLTNKK